jgi:hypothetical protein
MLGSQSAQQGDGLMDDMGIKRWAETSAIGIEGKFCVINFNAICGSYAEANTVMGCCIGCEINDRFQQEIEMFAGGQTLARI